MKSIMNAFLWAQHHSADKNFHIAITILRIVTGLALCTVFEKFMPREGIWGPQEWFVNDVASMGFPAPAFFAWLAVSIEFIGGLLLMLGVLSRPMAFLNTLVTGAAAFIHHSGDISNKGLMAFAFFIMCLTLTFSGGGLFSIDALIRRKHRE